MPGPLRKLVRSAAQRLISPGRVGEGFPPGAERAFATLHDSAEGVFGQVGAALTSTWEVLLTDVGRAMSARVPEAERRVLVERLSDALVPTAGALRHAERPFQAALTEGVKQARRQDRLALATEPLAACVGALGEPVAAGWSNTQSYLQPWISAFPDPESLRGALVFTGGELRQVFDRQAQTYGDQLRALPGQDDLQKALLEATDAWKRGVVRGVEVAIYGLCAPLLAAIARRS